MERGPSTESNARAPLSWDWMQYFLTAPCATSARRASRGRAPGGNIEPRRLANDRKKKEKKRRRRRRRRERRREGGGGGKKRATRQRPIDSPSSILIRLPVNRPDVNTVHLIGTTGRCSSFFPLIHHVIHERRDAIDASVSTAMLATSP